MLYPLSYGGRGSASIQDTALHRGHHTTRPSPSSLVRPGSAPDSTYLSLTSGWPVPR